MNTPKRMEIYYAKLIKTKGSVQYGRRPVLVVSNDVANRFAETVVVVPMTSRQKNNIPTHIVIDLGGRKSPRSTIMCEQVRTISTKQLETKIGKIEDPEVIAAVNQALSIAVGLDNRFKWKKKHEPKHR